MLAGGVLGAAANVGAAFGIECSLLEKLGASLWWVIDCWFRYQNY